MKKLLILFALFLISKHLIAQEKVYTDSKQLNSISGGGHFSWGKVYALNGFGQIKDRLPHEFADMGNKWSVIGGLYFYKGFGFYMGFSFYDLEINANKVVVEYEKLYPNKKIIMYAQDAIHLREAQLGISYHKKLRNYFSIEPRILFGIGSIRTPYFDVYIFEKNTENIEKTIQYTYQLNSLLSISTSLNLSYLYPIAKDCAIGLQLSTEYTSASTIMKYSTTMIDVKEKTTNQSDKIANINSSFFSWYIGGRMLFYIN